MAIISNVRNDGNPAVKTGPRYANSYNVYPTNIVATAGTTVFTPDLLANSDWFNMAQTSASSDTVAFSEVLNSAGNPAIPVGATVTVYCVSACKIIGQGTNTFNGGTTGQGITLAAGSTYEFIKTTSTTWVVAAQSASGTYSAPSPS